MTKAPYKANETNAADPMANPYFFKFIIYFLFFIFIFNLNFLFNLDLNLNF